MQSIHTRTYLTAVDVHAVLMTLKVAMCHHLLVKIFSVILELLLCRSIMGWTKGMAIRQLEAVVVSTTFHGFVKGYQSQPLRILSYGFVPIQFSY